MYIDIDIMDCFETIEKTGPNCRQEGKKLLCMCMNFEKTILEFFTGMLPLCYYPYIHTQTAKQRSSNLERTLGLYDIMSKVRNKLENNTFPDIKQEPSSPAEAGQGEDGHCSWGGGGVESRQR